MKENIAIAPAELRQSERYAPLQGRQGKLSLSIEGQSEIYGVLTLQDVSPFGVGLESRQLIEKGAHIQLIYEEANLVLAVVGTVAWHNCSKPTKADATNQGKYRLGIALHPANIEKNIYFFRYMSGIK